MMILKSHLPANTFALAVCKVSSLHLNQDRINTPIHPNVYICLGAWLKGWKEAPVWALWLTEGSGWDGQGRVSGSTGLGALLSGRQQEPVKALEWVTKGAWAW